MNILWAADWSNDGAYIAIGGNSNSLKIYNGDDFNLYKKLPVQNTITKLKWHPNQNILAIATQISSEKCSILDISTGEFIYLDSISTVGARAIGWNYNGEYLAVGDNEGHLIIYSTSGKYVKKKKVDKIVTGLSWHPTQNRIVSVGSQIALYDVDDGEFKNIRPRPEDVLMLCTAWHPSGEFFATGDYGDYQVHHPALLQLWDHNGNNIKDIEESKAEYRNIVWNKNGELLWTASEALRLWSKEGLLIKQAKSKNLLWGIDINNRNGQIVTSDEKGDVIIWTNNLKKLKKLN
jgi:WD40 repeat protein